MDDHRKALQQCSVELRNKLNPDAIVPYLLRDNMLTGEEEHSLTDPKKSREQKINDTICLLPTKGSDSVADPEICKGGFHI